MTIANRDDFKTASKCHICDTEYTVGDVMVRDHCHVTVMYRGSAHKDCNVKFRLTDKIPVIFHNLRGYDSHFIMQEIGKFKMDINVIPNNMEKYMAFMLGKHLVFLDSLQFMSSSLKVFKPRGVPGYAAGVDEEKGHIPIRPHGEHYSIPGNGAAIARILLQHPQR